MWRSWSSVSIIIILGRESLRASASAELLLSGASCTREDRKIISLKNMVEFREIVKGLQGGGCFSFFQLQTLMIYIPSSVININTYNMYVQYIPASIPTTYE